jgi:hypothetical protein
MTPEHEIQHHSHRTGHRLLDLALPISALILSVISLVIGIHHGRTMQDMAKENARLVQANSWPLLQYTTGNTNDSGQPEISMKIENAGVGPAKVISLEVFHEDQPIRRPVDLIRALDPTEPKPLLSLGVNLPMVLRSGTDTLIMGMKREGVEALWDKLNRERFRLRFRACYCSVFDECWVSDLMTVSPQPVDQCTKSPDSFSYLNPASAKQ